MTTTLCAESNRDDARPAASDGLARRFRPLRAAMFLQGIALWVPIEKLFMTRLGFDAAAIGVLAAAYAAATPLLEIPAGILADRWSRRGVLMLANGAATLSALIGALSHSVATYIVSALMLGGYFALQSGTVEAIVYDTLLEQTGASAGFERHIGRLHLSHSAALIASALIGGWLAAATSPRATYFLTVPFAVGSVVALAWLREPRRHHGGERTSLGRQIATTYTTIITRGTLRPVVAASVLLAALLQLVLEFGPLWLVALHVSATWYGPFTAALVSALGAGGLLAARIDLRRPAVLAAVVGVGVTSSLVLVSSRTIVLVTVALVALALLAVTATTFLTRLLHDMLPSSIRTGIASGVSTLSWLAFLPLAFVFGLASNTHGPSIAGWLVVAVTVASGILLTRAARRASGH